MSREALHADVAAVVGESNASVRGAVLAAAGASESSKKTAVLARPGSAAEVAELVKLASARGLAVIPVGAGTRLSPTGRTSASLLLDLRRLNHIVKLDETSLLVHVGAGLTALELEEILTPRGLTLGDFPPNSLGSSIGGLLAVRTPGKTSTRHGFMEDAVIGISAVLADGRTIHTRIAPRRASGPDLARAICGSEGTLGVITSAVLRIHRQPEARLLAAFSLPKFGAALAAVRLALREEASPAAMRVLDDNEAAAFFGESLRPPDGRALLLVATAGPTDLASCDRELVASAVTALGGERQDDALAQTWWAQRTGKMPPSMRRSHLQVSATPGKQLAVYEAVRDAAHELGVGISARASRFDQGGAMLFFTLSDSDGGTHLSDARGEELRAALEETAASAGAYLLGAWNRAHAPYFTSLRAALDPGGILNPDVG